MYPTVHVSCKKIIDSTFLREKTVVIELVDGTDTTGIFPCDRINEDKKLLEVLLMKEDGDRALISDVGGNSGGYGFNRGSIWVPRRLIQKP